MTAVSTAPPAAPSIALSHAWLQKHPTPTAASGEFHWHPAAPPRGLLRDAERLALVDRLRGVVPPAALWQLAPGRVVWAHVFAATAPGDGRRYCGLAVTIASAPGARAADLLASIVVPPAAPWAAGPVERDVAAIEVVAAALTSTQRAHRDTVLPAPAAVVRALISGGVAGVADPAWPDLPAWIASLEAWLPSAMTQRPRQGEWRGLAGHAARSPAGDAPRGLDDLVAALVVDAWCPPDAVCAARTCRAWAIATELAASQARGVDAVVAELHDSGDIAHALTGAELARIAVLGAPPIPPWLHAVHHWGRGRLDGRAASSEIVTRLADLVAMRALADHVGGGDERAALDHVRWHALLPVARRRALVEALVARVPSLAELVEGRAGWSGPALEVARA